MEPKVYNQTVVNPWLISAQSNPGNFPGTSMTPYADLRSNDVANFSYKPTQTAASASKHNQEKGSLFGTVVKEGLKIGITIAATVIAGRFGGAKAAMTAGAAVSGALSAADQKLTTGRVDWVTAGIDTVLGAVPGGVGKFFGERLGLKLFERGASGSLRQAGILYAADGAAIGAGGGAAHTAYDTYKETGSVDLAATGKAAVISGVVGSLFGGILGVGSHKAADIVAARSATHPGPTPEPRVDPVETRTDSDVSPDGSTGSGEGTDAATSPEPGNTVDEAGSDSSSTTTTSAEPVSSPATNAGDDAAVRPSRRPDSERAESSRPRSELSEEDLARRDSERASRQTLHDLDHLTQDTDPGTGPRAAHADSEKLTPEEQQIAELTEAHFGPAHQGDEVFPGASEPGSTDQWDIFGLEPDAHNGSKADYIWRDPFKTSDDGTVDWTPTDHTNTEADEGFNVDPDELERSMGYGLEF